MTLHGNTGDSTIVCTIDNYADFLSTLTFLLGFGFIWGHISHASRKLFMILNKMYVYITLPALSFYAAISIRIATELTWDASVNGYVINGSNVVSNHPPDSQQRYVFNILIVDLITKGSFWLIIVLGFLIVFRDRKILKTAAITAQLIIHGNDIGFSQSLLESTCKMKLNSETDHIDDIDFMAIEVPTNVMSFLIFLPLTHGLVGMCQQNNPCFKSFAKNMVRQMGKLSISYLSLFLGILIAVFVNFDKIPTKLESFHSLIRMSGTLQTLTCGIYIYYLLMNCDWGELSVRKSLAMAGCITILYPLVYYGTMACGLINTTSNDQLHFETIIMGHCSAPASIYIQYYIIKYVRSPTNYIAAFLISTMLGTLLMYTFVIDVTVLSIPEYVSNYTSPTDFYVHTERWEYLLTSIVLLLIVSMLIYGRTNHNSILRKLIFILMLIELLSDLIIGIGGLLRNTLKDLKVAVPMFLSAAGMYNHICISAITLILFLYHKLPQIMRQWKWIISVILLGSLCITTVVYLGTYFWFINSDLDYSYKSIDFFLDLRKNESDTGITKPIGTISYTIINCTFLIVYVLAMVFYRMTEQPLEDNEVLLRENQENLDMEKKLPCKWMLYYELTVITLSLSFGIRNINYAKVQNFSKTFADYILEFFELLNLILCDLGGAYMTLIFCISPGNMEREFDRLMYLPRKIRSFFRWCTQDSNTLQIEDVPRWDLDRCRKFQLFHKQAFVAHYPPTLRGNAETFKGRDLVRFLIETDVADSPGEAVDFGISYIKGCAIATEENGVLFRNMPFPFIGDDTTYTLTPDDQLPDYQEILGGMAQPERPFIYLDY